MDLARQDSVLSDQSLLAACRAGDEQGWLRLLDKYERLVFSIPLNYGLSREDAADITQNAFTALLQTLPDLRPDSNLGGWLATVARRQSWRLLAQRKREQLDPLDGELSSTLWPSHTGGIERWELIEWLHGGLTNLNQRCRHLLVALYFDEQERSYAQIAAELGMPEGSIGPTRARCLQRLKQLISSTLSLCLLLCMGDVFLGWDGGII
jgi:RNA polymerase sigma factor (sigma-70 family)